MFASVTAMTYDLANRLTGIDAAGAANDATFTLDALGRFRTRILATGTDTYSYVGACETVARISNSAGPTISDSIVSPAGDRLGVKQGATLNWFMPDLHGSVAASLSSDETIVSNAIRYDAYGQTIGTGSAGGTSVGEKTWTYQGRLDVSPAGLGSPLYDMSARMYSPGIGAFTSLDSVAGSAQNPLSMNRFLYAEANPATLIDPSGHAACSGWNDDCSYLQANTMKHEVRRAARTRTDRDRQSETRVMSRRASVTNLTVARQRWLTSRDAKLETDYQRRVPDVSVVLATDLVDVKGANVRIYDPRKVFADARKAGLNWEDTALDIVRQQYPDDLYSIERGHTIKNEEGVSIRINGKVQKPDFQVWNRASGRLVAGLEAENGTLEYLSGEGEAALLRYDKAFAQAGRPEITTKAIYAERPRVETPGIRALRLANKAIGPLMLLSTVLQAIQIASPSRDSQAMEWLKANDPDYYRSIVCQTRDCYA